MAVDKVVWPVEDGAVIHNGLGHAAGQSMGVLYADDGIIRSRDLEWLQGALNILIGLFYQIGLMANVARSKTMTCHPGTICLVMSKEAVGQRSTGEGDNCR